MQSEAAYSFLNIQSFIQNKGNCNIIKNNKVKRTNKMTSSISEC